MMITDYNEEINSKILSISEDKINGFQRDPFLYIAEKIDLPIHTILNCIREMLKVGIIRRVRQTLITNNLAPGALIAWRIPEQFLEEGFNFLFQKDPFSGHVVIRSTDQESAVSDFRLWTTLKVPIEYSMEEHCQFLSKKIKAEQFLIMPAKAIFTLGVGHVRRKTCQPGDRSEHSEMMIPKIVSLTEKEWKVLLELKKEFTPAEIRSDPWFNRSKSIDMSLDEFCEIAESFVVKKILGRFSTFLEHVKPSPTGVRVTRFNALFHWAVPKNYEEKAGIEVGRHDIMTHCYWREGGDILKNVNIMGVAHGIKKNDLLAHKDAIDQHLIEKNIPILYTNIFWGGRSEIKPSEISAPIYREWRKSIESIK